MDRVVVSIGGSVLIPEKDDAKYIKALADMLRDVSKEVEIMVVCGGGKVSRYYSKTGKELGGTTYQLDELGIGVTKVNAKLLDIALGDAGIGKVPQTAEECASERHIGKVPVMGGTEPGHTTDAVAAMIAKACDADRIVNASNVDAVYTDDPRTSPNAKRLDKITIDDLEEIVYDEHDACRSSVFDPLGVKIAKEHRIDILMVDGRDLVELKNAILGKEINGTFVNSQ